MNRANRRDSLSRFILTFGAADMVIGGLDGRFSLFLLGLTTVSVGVLVRWARSKRSSLKSGLEFSTREPDVYPTERPLDFKRIRILPPAAPKSRQPQNQQPADSSERRYRERRIY